MGLWSSTCSDLDSPAWSHSLLLLGSTGGLAARRIAGMYATPSWTGAIAPPLRS